MASQVHDAAKAIRDAKVAERQALVDAMKALKPNSAAWLKARDNVIRKSSEVREQGNIMRAEEGRQMGEGTSYTGALQDSTKDAIAALTAKENLVPLNPVTDWQQANINIFKDIDSSLSYQNQRREWDRLWGDDRDDMLRQQLEEVKRIRGGDDDSGDDDSGDDDSGDDSGDSPGAGYVWNGTDWVWGGDDGSTSGDDSASGGVGSMNLLNYRPWTKKYWSENIPKDAQGLLYMGLPQREYGISYLPGEHRDPTGWHNWVTGGHKGQPPSGSWRFSPQTYKGKGGKNVPWLFSAAAGPTPGAETYNIDFKPWNATSMNLSPSQGLAWQGLLNNIGDTPTINTSATTLLGA